MLILDLDDISDFVVPFQPRIAIVKAFDEMIDRNRLIVFPINPYAGNFGIEVRARHGAPSFNVAAVEFFLHPFGLLSWGFNLKFVEEVDNEVFGKRFLIISEPFLMTFQGHKRMYECFVIGGHTWQIIFSFFHNCASDFDMNVSEASFDLRGFSFAQDHWNPLPDFTCYMSSFNDLVRQVLHNSKLL